MKYLYNMKLGRKRIFAYRHEVLLNIFVNIISIFILQKFWKTLYYDNKEQYYYMANYAILAQILSIIYFMNTPNKLSQNIRTGAISIEMLRPWSYITSLLFEDLGTILGSLLITGLPLVLISSLLFHFMVPSAIDMIMFIICVFFAFLILFLVRTIVAMICFWLVEASSLLILVNVIVRLLSGQFLPSWLVPFWLQRVMDSLPFIWVYQKPIEIYLARVNSDQYVNVNYLSVIVMQLGWILGLLIIAHFMWIKAVRKLNIQGG